jgi:hypothetical protein
MDKDELTQIVKIVQQDINITENDRDKDSSGVMPLLKMKQLPKT